MAQTSTIVVLLPGTGGSNLIGPNQHFNTEIPVWRSSIFGDFLPFGGGPNAALKALQGTLYAGIPYGANTYNALLPELVVGYGKLIRYFTTQHGFQYVSAQTSTPEFPAPHWGLPSSLTGNLLIGVGYDWRADNSTSAKNLQSLLSTIDSLYGSSYQLYLLAHSMGGLVARAYLETSISSGDSWLSKIKGLITLGTPHLGAPLALEGIVGNWQDLPPKLASEPLETVAHSFIDSRFSDSTYELLPPPSQKFIKATDVSYSIFDENLPADLQQLLQTGGLLTENLRSALAFLRTLNYQGIDSLPPYYCAYGTFANSATAESHKTCMWMEFIDGKLSGRDLPDGDTIVPAWSAMFSGRPVADVFPAPEVTHGGLPSDSKVQQKVSQWLGLSQAASGLREDAA